MNINLINVTKTKGLTIFLAIIGLLWGCNQPHYKASDLKTTTLPVSDSIPEDQNLESFIAPYRDTLEMQMNRTIGQSQQELLAGFPESPLSNFVADLLLYQSQIRHTDSTSWPTPQFSVINIRGLRAPITKGDITVHDIFQLMPFENELVIIELSGREVMELLNYMASVDGDGIAGVQFGIKNGKPVNIKLAGKDLVMDHTYTLATSDYLANGGDHFDVLKKANVKNGTGYKIRDLIIEHIEALTKQGKKISASLDKRIYHVTK